MTYSTAEYLLWAYRLILGREPDRPDMLDKVPPQNRKDILRRFLYSPDFRKNSADVVWPITMTEVMIETASGTRFWLLTADPHISRGIAHNRYEPAETAFIARYVRPGMHVLDIGANLGWHTIKMSQCVGTAGSVTAFEPRPDLAGLLRRTIIENQASNVVLHECALGDDESEIYIGYPPDDPNPGGSAIWKIPPQHYITHKVPLRRLDKLLGKQRVHFVKIDVEGAEPLVFEGAKGLLKHKPTILSEINSSCLRRVANITGTEFLARCASFGYTAYRLNGDGEIADRVTECSDNVLFNIVLLPADGSSLSST